MTTVVDNSKIEEVNTNEGVDEEETLVGNEPGARSVFFQY
jgi:hypothetical protein